MAAELQTPLSGGAATLEPLNPESTPISINQIFNRKARRVFRKVPQSLIYTKFC